MQTTIMVLGALAEAIGWRLVAASRATVWRLMPPILLAMGVAAALTRRPVVASRVGGGAAFLVGTASGLAL